MTISSSPKSKNFSAHRKERFRVLHYKIMSAYRAGIHVDKTWLDQATFLDWCFDNYNEGGRLRRIDMDAGFSPNNCEFSDFTNIGRNRWNNHLLTVGETTACVAYWTELCRLERHRIFHWIARGGDQYAEAHIGAILGRVSRDAKRHYNIQQEHVENFEKESPNDFRVRRSWKATEKWRKNPTPAHFEKAKELAKAAGQAGSGALAVGCSKKAVRGAYAICSWFFNLAAKDENKNQSIR